MLQLVVSLVVVVAAVLVLVDASRLGARRGALGGGPLDVGPLAWSVLVLLASVVALPAYLVARRRLVARGAGSTPATAAETAEPADDLTPDLTRDLTPAVTPVAPSRGARHRRGRHRAERPGRRTPSRADSAASAERAVLERAVVEPAVVESTADPVPDAPDLVPPFAAATSWAPAPVERVDDADLFAPEPALDPADLVPPVDDAPVGAFAPGGSAPGPLAAEPFAAGPFAVFAAGAAPYEPPAPVEVAPAGGALAPHVTTPLDSFAELVSMGLMSAAEYERVRARLGSTV